MTVLSCGLLNGGWVGGMKGVVQCALKARYNFICTHWSHNSGEEHRRTVHDWWMNDHFRCDVVHVIGWRRRCGRRSTPRVNDSVTPGFDLNDLTAVWLFCNAVLAVADVDTWLPPAARANTKDVFSFDDMIELKIWMKLMIDWRLKSDGFRYYFESNWTNFTSIEMQGTVYLFRNKICN